MNPSRSDLHTFSTFEFLRRPNGLDRGDMVSGDGARERVESVLLCGEKLLVCHEKVTDLIFKARVVRDTQTRSAYRETAAVHEDAGGYGVGGGGLTAFLAWIQARPQRLHFPQVWPGSGPGALGVEGRGWSETW